MGDAHERGGPRKGRPDTTDQPPSSIDQAEDERDEPGFWRKAMSGKVRPAPREPEVSHYCCSCCRWSA